MAPARRRFLLWKHYKKGFKRSVGAQAERGRSASGALAARCRDAYTFFYINVMKYVIRYTIQSLCLNDKLIAELEPWLRRVY